MSILITPFLVVTLVCCSDWDRSQSILPWAAPSAQFGAFIQHACETIKVGIIVGLQAIPLGSSQEPSGEFHNHLLTCSWPSAGDWPIKRLVVTPAHSLSLSALSVLCVLSLNAHNSTSTPACFSAPMALLQSVCLYPFFRSSLTSISPNKPPLYQICRMVWFLSGHLGMGLPGSPLPAHREHCIS